jgi:hypothetical protein
MSLPSAIDIKYEEPSSWTSVVSNFGRSENKKFEHISYSELHFKQQQHINTYMY